MNKGLQIRNNKLKKKAQKRNTIKESQADICRFVTIRYEVIEKVNGKFRRTGNKTVSGLQIKNKVYLLNGHYKMLNSKCVKIMKIWTDIPDWADESLINKFNNNK